jgi:homoserine dehydrogenase
MENKLSIGLFGFGVVGEGIYQVLLQKLSLNATIKKICIKHPEKKRNAPAELFTTDYNDILNDPLINVVIELIDDADEAFKIVSTAITKNKAVVSANKKMIAESFPQLLLLQAEFEQPFLYEAAVCGSIPIIRNLEEYYDNELLESICGIVNGSTNFILTKIFKEKIDYKIALAEAQSLGFAEWDPHLDVSGMDAANKLTILLLHGHGILTSPKNILHLGIENIHAEDAKYALGKRWQIKLTAQAKRLKNGKVAAFVLPQFVSKESQLYNVENEFNGVVLQSALSDKQFLYGKGAGRFPTASAVLSDISALRYQYKYEYRKHQQQDTGLETDFLLWVYVSCNSWADLDMEDFAWIDAIHTTEQRQYVTGGIRFKTLSNATWIRRQGVSLIVLPDGIIQEMNFDLLDKKFLSDPGCLVQGLV